MSKYRALKIGGNKVCLNKIKYKISNISKYNELPEKLVFTFQAA